MLRWRGIWDKGQGDLELLAATVQTRVAHAWSRASAQMDSNTERNKLDTRIFFVDAVAVTPQGDARSQPSLKPSLPA